MAEAFQQPVHAVDRVEQAFPDLPPQLGARPEQPNLHDVVERIPYAVLFLDRDWRIVYANAEARRLSRIPSEAIGSKTHWELYPEIVGTEIERRYRAAMESGVFDRVQHYHGRFDIWLDIGLYPSSEGLTLYYRDVTSEKRTAESRDMLDERLAHILDVTSDAIAGLDLEWNFRYVNRRARELLGANEDLVGRNLWRELLPEGAGELEATLRRTMQKGVPADCEDYYFQPLGRWLSIQARRSDYGIVIFFRDVTERRRREQALLDQQELLSASQRETERQRAELETIYQTAPVGLAQFDPVEFRCLRLNERQAEMLGLPSDQVVGRRFDEVAPVTGLLEMLQVAAEGHAVKNQIIEGVLPTRPGEHRAWNVSHAPVYADDGSVQAITAAWLEITHLKKAESALVQSEKLAAVGRLASSISHEINNPLEAITNLLYLISESDQLPQELAIYVHMAQSELSRVSQIATQTLRFHRQTANPTWVSPAELLDAVLNLYHGRLTNSGVRVQTRYSTDRKILCFENDIRQVLNNLIANAIDAMRQGGRLLVRAHETTQHSTGRRGVRMTIADTGHGMPEAVRRRLFQPFYTTKGLHGTGLGLWISEGIVKRHRGRMEVRSCQDPVRHGTVFTLFLPFESAVEHEKAA